MELAVGVFSGHCCYYYSVSSLLVEEGGLWLCFCFHGRAE